MLGVVPSAGDSTMTKSDILGRKTDNKHTHTHGVMLSFFLAQVPWNL